LRKANAEWYYQSVKNNKKGNRYTAVGPETKFADKQGRVLVNKLGITRLRQLQIREEEGLVDCYQRMIKRVRFDTPLSNALICEIHREIFGELFEWAGKWRASWISKGQTVWANPVHIESLMQTFEAEILQRAPLSQTIGDGEFCSIVALIQGEFLTIHPFREGNARTIKVLTDLYAVQTGRRFLIYDQTEPGQTEYINAAIAAMGRDLLPMEAVIHGALIRSYDSNDSVDPNDDETLDSTEASLQ
jgi:cell filamentation protein